MTIQSPLVYELCNLASSERHLHHCAMAPHLTGADNVSPFIYLFIYTYNDILNNAEAINVEVMMRMLKILWKETERKRVVEN